MEKEPLLSNSLDSSFGEERRYLPGEQGDVIDAIVTGPEKKKRFTSTLAAAIAASVIGSSCTVGFNIGALNEPSQDHSDAKHKYTEDDIVKMLTFFIDNIFVEFAGQIFQQVIGIPMGTNCAPLLADLFLYSYEAEFIQGLLAKGEKKLAQTFNFSFRYIDELLSLNNPRFHDFTHLIYPKELELKDTTDTPCSASYLDLFLRYDTNGKLYTRIYDKRDDFNFSIVNFPFLCSNIPASPAYGVYISQQIRYGRACSNYEDFIARGQLLTTRLQHQGYTSPRLKSTFRKFFGRQHDIVGRFTSTLAAAIAASVIGSSCIVGFNNGALNEPSQGVTGSLALSIAACALGSPFVFGFHTGVVNTPQKVMQDFYNETYYKRNDKYMTDSTITLLWAITVSIFALGGMFGGLSGGYFANHFGRRGAMLRNNVLNLIAGGLLLGSKFAGSYEMIIAGRFIIGICAGINTAVAPLYLSEIAPITLRGLAGTFNQLAICFGVLLSEIIGLSQVLGRPDTWNYLLAFTFAPMLFQLCTLTFCPESPRYLMIYKNNEDQAERALQWLRQDVDVSDEIEEMKTEYERQRKTAKFRTMDLFYDRALLKPLIISLVLQLSQQLGGINAVIYYSTDIFKNAGLSKTNAQGGTVGAGVVNVAMTFVSALIMDRAGRRILLLIGLGGMFVFSIVLSIALIFQDKYSWLSYIGIVAVMMYIVFFAAGPGAIPWLIVAELFAQGPRSAAVSLSVLINWLANFAVGVGYLELERAIGPYSFIPFVVLLLLFWIFTFLMVPETKGKTIEEITAMFKHPVQKSQQIQDNGTSVGFRSHSD